MTEEEMSIAEEQVEEEIVAPSWEPIESVYYMYPGIGYVGFVKKLASESGLFNKKADDPLAIGTILKAEGEKKAMISQNDTVYISSASSKKQDQPFIVGKRYISVDRTTIHSRM